MRRRRAAPNTLAAPTHNARCARARSTSSVVATPRFYRRNWRFLCSSEARTITRSRRTHVASCVTLLAVSQGSFVHEPRRCSRAVRTCHPASSRLRPRIAAVRRASCERSSTRWHCHLNSTAHSSGSRRAIYELRIRARCGELPSLGRPLRQRAKPAEIRICAGRWRCCAGLGFTSRKIATLRCFRFVERSA